MKPYQKSKTIKTWEAKFPELANLDRIANHWAKELMTLFPEKCVKNWIKNYLHIEAMINKSEKRHIILASSLGIISTENEYPQDTVIFVQDDKNHAKLFFWGNRYNQFLWKRIEKKDDKSFIVSDTQSHEVKQYRDFENKQFTYHADTANAYKGETGFYDELYSFKTSNLVSSMIHNNKEAKSKGAKTSNSNSDTQSKRSYGKIRSGKICKMEFHNGNGNTEQEKSPIEAYRIVAGSSGWNGTYQGFYQKLKKSAGSEVRFDCVGKNGKPFTVYCTLVVYQPAININNNIDGVGGLNLKDRIYIYSGFVNSPEPTAKDNNQKARREWEAWCDSLGNDPDMCWTFDEWLELQAA